MSKNKVPKKVDSLFGPKTSKNMCSIHMDEWKRVKNKVPNKVDSWFGPKTDPESQSLSLVEKGVDPLQNPCVQMICEDPSKGPFGTDSAKKLKNKGAASKHANDQTCL